ncbi:hypothetical protein JTE90_028073 [Oedothorax gibbosus]|uniref:Uncharacterized protein n=1 Tax=Oedothorax gibbosus TaxID=931172 RepID=A0AAV6V8K7_9ARAC|nr:hypothetical protein JTE90_028073 [Oedothorax gibbosus]
MVGLRSKQTANREARLLGCGKRATIVRGWASHGYLCMDLALRRGGCNFNRQGMVAKLLNLNYFLSLVKDSRCGNTPITWLAGLHVISLGVYFQQLTVASRLGGPQKNMSQSSTKNLRRAVFAQQADLASFKPLETEACEFQKPSQKSHMIIIMSSHPL